LRRGFPSVPLPRPRPPTQARLALLGNEKPRLYALRGWINLSQQRRVNLAQRQRKELYREINPNFNLYCHERWGIGRSYANKLIGSAERIKLLPEETPRPANEFQIRPFLKLDPQEFPKKWQEIVETAGEEKVTSKIVEDSLGLGRKKRRRRKARGSDQKKEVNELLASLRAALEKKEVGDALKQLARLEKLLGV
jgi:hypothetical protein